MSTVIGATAASTRKTIEPTPSLFRARSVRASAIRVSFVGVCSRNDELSKVKHTRDTKSMRRIQECASGIPLGTLRQLSESVNHPRELGDEQFSMLALECEQRPDLEHLALPAD